MRDDLTIAECLSRFAADRYPGSAYLSVCRRAIRWYERVHVSPTVVSDLNPETFALATDRMLAAGLAPSTVDVFLECLTTLWRFAARQGHVASPTRRRRRQLYWRHPGRQRHVRQSILSSLPSSMPRLVEIPRAARPGSVAEPEIVLPTFDGAAVVAAAPETAATKQIKYSKHRKKW